MKKKILSSILLILLILFAAAPACTSKTENSESKQSNGAVPRKGEDMENTKNYGTDEPVIEGAAGIKPDFDSLDKNAKSWELSTSSCHIKISLGDGGKAAVTSFKSAGSDNEWIKEPAYFKLPKKYRLETKFTDHAWKYAGASFTGAAGTLSLYYEDKTAAAAYMISCKGCEIAGPFEFSAKIFNFSENDIRVFPGDYFIANVCADAVPDAWRIAKESGEAEGFDRFPGSGIYTEPLSAGKKYVADVSTFQDHNSGGFIPMIYIDDSSERGVFAAMEWSSGCVAARGFDFADGTAGGVELSVNLGSNFNTILPSGDALYIPTVYFGSYTGDVDDGSNLFRRWFFNEKSPACLRENENEPLTQMDIQLGLDVEGLGIQSIKWDYGWWSNDRDPDSYEWTRTLEGDWKLRNTAYLGVLNAYNCSGMGEFGSLAKERGLNWTLYWLLHDSRSETEDALTSVGENGHPEWFSNRKITSGHSADLGNEDCVKFLQTTMTKLFREYNIGTWRSDFEPICCFSDKQNRHDADGNDVQYWCTVGFLELVDQLYANVEGFRYESCSSGGSMKDFLTMTRAVVINNDDSANYNSLRTTFYNSSYCIHPAQLQLPCNPDTFCRESQFYDEPGNKDYGMRSVIIGVPMFGSWSGPEDGKLRFGLNEYYAKYLNMYNEKIKPIQRDGELYHILPRPDNVNWDGIQYADPDSPNEIKGVVFLFKPTDSEGAVKNIVLRGLDPDAAYSLEFEDRPEQNTSKTGAELMSAGIEVTIEQECGSEIIWIK